MDKAVKKTAAKKEKPVKIEKASSPKRKKSVSLDAKKSRAGWIFVLPFLIGLIILYIPIVVNSINMSFNEYIGGNINPVGFDNYQEALFEDPDFIQILLGGIKDMIFNIPAIVFLSLFLAILLNQKMAGRAVFRAILFVPVILSTGLIDSIDATSSSLLDHMGSDEGVDTGLQTESATDIISAADISILFSNMKVGTGLVSYITTLVNDIYNIVNDAGVQLLIFLAGLQSISPAIYESCNIDGATAWETFWKVTFPMISPMILVNAVYTVIDSFTKADNSVMTFISNYYSSKSPTVATAMAWIYFVVVALIVVVIMGVLKAFVFYQRRD